MIQLQEILNILNQNIAWTLFDSNDNSIICDSSDLQRIIKIYGELPIEKISIDTNTTLLFYTKDLL